ncbi:hypothetical protein F5J12DRAFT_905741 [Pisolithus orientalis]|uniref:uncharacterized protein n=1 Tax=Pisolithus orientalis TaxID=936130 RepID=UPI002224BFF6|nr:uncharacterized protein F5J12DRAFT_905741 [Pisolithus orientalis]KAI6006270.1 hypothetical protein F5J12DRAFT_905741 [Pisolithus orientalis]
MTAPGTHSSTETSNACTALPSPPTSPVSTAGNITTTRIRLKAIRAPRAARNSSIESVSVQSECRDDSCIKAKRRQSSIAYFTPSSPSPWERGGQRHRPSSSRAGLNSTPSPSTRSELLEDENGGGERASLAISPCSRPCGVSVSSPDGVDAKEREPLTLIEKHADLLHFIAQKERKCLELREQLAVHENELAELKRKWERIINRTLPMAGSGYENLVSTSSTNAVLGSTALDGIKEGVRRITLGLSDLGGGTNTESSQHIATHFQDGSSSSSAGALSGFSICEAEVANGSTHVDAVRSSSTDAISTIRRSGSLHRRPARSLPKDPPTPVQYLSSAAPVLRQTATSPSIPTNTTADKQSRRTTLAPALPPPSSVPGLGSLTMGASVGNPVSSWMGSVGKKLGEIQGADTLTKGQKRASVLLADVSHSIISALSPSPSTVSALSPTSNPISSPRAPYSNVSANRDTGTLRTNSLLDDDDDNDTVRIGRVMVPDSVKDKTGAVAGSGSQTQEGHLL